MSVSNVYGYARVSSKDQNLNRQLDALDSFPVSRKNIYADKASGKDFERPEYKRLMNVMKPGDVMVIKSIDRLGRNYNEIIEEWRNITKRMRCAIVVLDMPLLDTRESSENLTGVFISDIVLQLLSYIAEVERKSIKQRQAEGIASAKARGVRFGRPPIKRPRCYSYIREVFLAGGISRKEAAHRLNVSITTFEKWLDSDDKTWRNLLKG
jgi:DNA invertase Pin-like site-specific DNA recombinase